MNTLNHARQLASAAALGATLASPLTTGAEPPANTAPRLTGGSPGRCANGPLGTARTLRLPHAAAAYGSMQHGRLPLAAHEVVLTFDDGPDAASTPAVMAALKAQGVRATFFLIGESLAQQPGLARALLADGHSLGLHSNRHDNFSQLSPAAQQADITTSRQRHRQLLGQEAAVWRYPYLAETPESRAMLAAAGLTVLSADLGIEDWEPAADAAALAQRLFDRLDRQGGGIVLLHDNQPQTAEALPLMLSGLCERGWQIVHLEWAPPP